MGRDQSITTPHRHAATPHPTQIPSPTPMINLSYAALWPESGAIRTLASSFCVGAGGVDQEVGVAQLLGVLDDDDVEHGLRRRVRGGQRARRDLGGVGGPAG